jgi:TfoX/Sxy family transcriptional regulator of competence genes
MAAKAKSARMPKFTPASEKTISLFQDLVKNLPEAEPRKMFGYPCAFVNGQMFVGVFQDRLMLRLSDEDRARFLKLPGAKLFEPMPGRPMREYVELTPAILNSDATLRRWIARGLDYAKSLPPKAKPARGAKKAGK